METVFTKQSDISEDMMMRTMPGVLEILLKDRSTGKNIIWASDDYVENGEGYSFADEITAVKIIGEHERLIMPRIYKSIEIQQKRAQGKGEVFTPAWICNLQNNAVDEAWFGMENITGKQQGAFNRAEEGKWEVNEEKILFPEAGRAKQKSWQSYVRHRRMEITCGEAPYLASRYDSSSGEMIEVRARIGMLDRKLRVISENADCPKRWCDWAIIAVQNTYGYDWQGDNVLLARENVLFTVIEHYKEHYNRDLPEEIIKELAEIISWNIWQMDGLKYVVPGTCHEEVDIKPIAMSLFGEEVAKPKMIMCPGCTTGNPKRHNGIACKIYDWVNKKELYMRDFL